MDNKTVAKRTIVVLGILALAALFLYIVLKATSLLVIIFAAWISAETLEIPVRFLKRKMKRFPAVLLTLLLTLILVALVVLIIFPPVIEELINLFELAKHIPDLIENTQAWYDDFRLRYDLLQNILPPAPTDLNDLLGSLAVEEGALINALEQTLPIVTNIGAAVGLVIGQIVLFVFLTLLFMLEPDVYYNTLIDMIPERYGQRAREIIRMVRKNVNTWSGALLLSVGITSVLYFVMLGLILGLPNALALSVIAGIATIIPTIGNTLALIPVIIVAAPFGPTRLILAIALYAAVGTLQDRIVTPAIMRSELSIPAGGQVIFQFVLSVLIGPIGFLLAVPLLAILITVIREVYVRDILGKSPPAEKIDTPSTQTPSNENKETERDERKAPETQ